MNIESVAATGEGPVNADPSLPVLVETPGKLGVDSVGPPRADTFREHAQTLLPSPRVPPVPGWPATQLCQS